MQCEVESVIEILRSAKDEEDLRRIGNNLKNEIHLWEESELAALREEFAACQWAFKNVRFVTIRENIDGYTDAPQ